MGFFSAVKKFFGQKDAAGTPADEQALVPPPVQDGGHGEITEQSQSSDIASSGAALRSPCPAEVLPEAPEPAHDSACTAEPGGRAGDYAPREEIARESSAPVAQTPELQAPFASVEDAAAAKDASPRLTAEAGRVQPPSLAGAEDLLLRLRSAEPRLSSWLAIILEDQDEVDEVFWQRLRFLLQSLEAPSAEIDRFLQDFERWLGKMEYGHVDEFRSELQYRLALALDLEDEEDERNRLLVKLETGLAATRARFGRRLDALFSGHARLDDDFWNEMEELFITADMGYETSLEIVERLKNRAAGAGVDEPQGIKGLMRAELEELFRLPVRIRAANKPEVVLMMGVNGAGKTTTIAKLAYRDRLNGKKVLVAAADTFRAAAMEQLKVWADRVGADFYQKPAGADPASVAWEAMDHALERGVDVVYVDTAGRLQTRVNLMEELGKIRQVLARKHPGAPHRNVLVLDATTGQNALSQAKLFKEAAGADEIVLTKLDGTAKGGVAIAVAMREKLPISYIGLGEKMEDLRPFDGGDFANALLEESSAA